MWEHSEMRGVHFAEYIDLNRQRCFCFSLLCTRFTLHMLNWNQKSDFDDDDDFYIALRDQMHQRILRP